MLSKKQPLKSDTERKKPLSGFPFEAAPEFLELDNRRFRPFNPVSFEQMHNKHSALLPEEIVRGKTVLDLGSCLGATGHWCLSMGATHYTGVEVQESYVETARPLFEQYHARKFLLLRTSIEEFLAESNSSYDIVCALGVIYVFTDFYSILKKISSMARETVVIESQFHDYIKLGENFCGVEFRKRQGINLSDENATLIGRGSRLSPKGLSFIMREFGFVSKEGPLKTKPLQNQLDTYQIPPIATPIHARFLMRFVRSEESEETLSENLRKGKTGDRIQWSMA